MEERVVYDIQQIKAILPHRYPFLMVDRVIEWVDSERITGIKNVSINEPFFQGHFPNEAVMPGVLVLEALAQVGAILAKTSTAGVGPDKIVYLVGADDVRWKRKVVPGDTLRLEMVFDNKKGPLWMMSGQVFCEGKLVVSGRISAAEGAAS